MRHAHYRKCVENLETVLVKQNIIRSKEHQLSTISQSKLALSAYDTKRWIMDDGIHTLAYGITVQG